MTNDTAMEVEISRVEGACALRVQVDSVAVEDPLELRVCQSGGDQSEPESLSVTMRTPGDDFELAFGLLFAEGLIAKRSDVESIEYAAAPADAPGAVLVVTLAEGKQFKPGALSRNLFTSSSCGVCSKPSIESLGLTRARDHVRGDLALDSALVHKLPDLLGSSQSVFARTGGLHAAALVNRLGDLLSIREDVGRHNAVDKLIGASLLAGELPLQDSILVLSGRASFELVQKAACAGVPIVAAVGAPSSLAVVTALQAGITLLGFVRAGRFNIYSHAERIRCT